MILVLDYGMGASLLLYLTAWFLIQSKTPARIKWHKVCALSGTLITTGIGLALIIGVNFMHGGDRSAVGIAPAVSEGWILAHRILATAVFVLMWYQTWLGMVKKIAPHRRLAAYFIVGYALVFISGLMFFQAA
jgi:uncharacterized membrane protein YozB (DUF420 family)